MPIAPPATPPITVLSDQRVGRALCTIRNEVDRRYTTGIQTDKLGYRRFYPVSGMVTRQSARERCSYVQREWAAKLDALRAAGVAGLAGVAGDEALSTAFVDWLIVCACEDTGMPGIRQWRVSLRLYRDDTWWLPVACYPGDAKGEGRARAAARGLRDDLILHVTHILAIVPDEEDVPPSDFFPEEDEPGA